jgi:hypothetical protein
MLTSVPSESIRSAQKNWCFIIVPCNSLLIDSEVSLFYGSHQHMQSDYSVVGPLIA